MNPSVILISGSYNAFREGFNGAGVYMASGLFESPTFTRPIYVGSAEDLHRRIQFEHIPELNSVSHHNKPFQAAWNKHDANFVWLLLEPCSPEATLVREQHYLDTLQPFVRTFGGYNIAEDAKAPMKGRNHSEEAKRKTSESLKGRRFSDEHRARIGEANKRRGQSEVTRAKLSKARTGAKHSAETKSRISESGKGKHGRKL